MINQQVINYLCKKLWAEESRKRTVELQLDLQHMRNIKDTDSVIKEYNLQIDRDNMREYALNKNLEHDCNVRIELLKNLIKEIKQLKGVDNDNN